MHTECLKLFKKRLNSIIKSIQYAQQQSPFQQKLKMQSNIKSALENLPNIHFILLINTKSGGGWGKRYLQLKKLHYHFEFKKSYNVYVNMVDLLNVKNRNQALNKAKILQQTENNDIRIIICGGDGTIIWGIQQCHRAGLKIQKVTFASLPIGTGNDFSRTIGWGSNPLQFQEGNLLPLKKRIIQWIESTTSKYDVWEVDVSIYEKGSIYVAKNGEDFLTNKKVHKTGFVNYVGMGIDARVSYNFQKHRKSTKLMNLCVYGMFGCIFCFKSIPELSSAVDEFQETQHPQNEITHLQSPMILKVRNLQDSMIENLAESEMRQSRRISIKQGYHGLICLNSISYMAGAFNAWQTKKTACIDKSINFQKQSVNDGKIQFIGYKNQLVLGLEKIIHSGAKVAQGEGPFILKFKEQQDLQIENYVQIDGEGLMIKGLREIVIRRNTEVPVISVMLGKKLK